MQCAVGRGDVRIVGVGRREAPIPPGAKMEMIVAEPRRWNDVIAATNASVLVCALGTTMHKVGKDKSAFRAVDRELVLACGRAAIDAGIDHVIVVSSVGAAISSSSFYLQTKAEMETQLRKLGLRRLDVVRPSLLIGSRRDRRMGERLAMSLAPVFNLFLHGRHRKYRAIRAADVARAILALVHQRPGGCFVHEFDAMQRVAERAGDYSAIDASA